MTGAPPYLKDHYYVSISTLQWLAAKPVSFENGSVISTHTQCAHGYLSMEELLLSVICFS